MADSPWNNPGVVAELERLYAKTQLSSREMMVSLNSLFNTNLSRNAVIGKIERLGLSEKYPLAVRVSAGGRKGCRAAEHPGLARVVNSVHDVSVRVVKVQEKLPRVSVRETEHDESVVLYKTFNGPLALADAPISIQELRDTTCRWPLGDKATPPYEYCGKATVKGLPYCVVHCRISYTAPPPRKPKK